ncbi:MAG: hypothetical protein A2Z73_04565 [Deltaproteobacteria bacterium RBG_13_60_28]|nr:MAG: hypothetical protein A2Z73_04565 [Deltaproteobacteria bacterium RBG_13_60_28]
MGFQLYYSNRWVVQNLAIFYRVLRGFARAFLLGKNTLKTIELYPTFDCQSNCLMCSVSKYRKDGVAKLTPADYRSLAKQGADLGAIAISILGGEPLLAEDLEEIVAICKEQRFFVTIVSNALAVSRERIKSLKQAGLDSIYFSVESLDEEINDRIRGVKGHFRKVMDAVDLCKSEGLLVGLAGVIFPGQVERFVELVEYCQAHGLLATGGELAKVGRGEELEIVSAGENARLRSLLQKHKRLTFDWGLSYFLKYRCPAGKEKIGVTCYGDVIGCSLNPLAFGNIKEEPLKKIWERMGLFSQYQKDSLRCLSAGDRDFIEDYLEPVAFWPENPIYFARHPRITPETESALFRQLKD